MNKLLFFLLLSFSIGCVTTNGNNQREVQSRLSASGDIDDIFFEKEIASMDQKSASFKNHNFIYEDRRKNKTASSKKPVEASPPKLRQKLTPITSTSIQKKMPDKILAQAKTQKQIEDELFSDNDPLFNKEFAFDEVGNASWYGEETSKMISSSGEKFDPKMLTATHPTLPIDSVIKISNLKNDREAVARINHNSRLEDKNIISVSKKIADILEFDNKKTTKVGLNVIRRGSDIPSVASEKTVVNYAESSEKVKPKEEVLKKKKKKKRQKRVSSQPKNYTVQLGAFSNSILAQNFKDKIKSNYKEKVYILQKNSYYLVQLGDFKTRYEAEILKNQVLDQDCDKCFIANNG